MDTFSMSGHVQQSIKVCNQRLYLLCQLKKCTAVIDQLLGLIYLRSIATGLGLCFTTTR